MYQGSAATSVYETLVQDKPLFRIEAATHLTFYICI